MKRVRGLAPGDRRREAAVDEEINEAILTLRINHFIWDLP